MTRKMRVFISLTCFASLFLFLLLLNSDSENEASTAVPRHQAMLALAPAGNGRVAGTVAYDGPLGERREYTVARSGVVNFSQVAASTGLSSQGQDQMLRLNVESDGILNDALMQKMRDAALNAPPTEGMQIAPTGRAPQAAIIQTNFDSIDYTQSGGSVPPDPEMAAGPNHVIATVNVALAVYDKTGTAVIGPIAAGSFFSNSPCTSGLYDPNVIYDEEEQRWFLAYDQGPQSATGGYCVLASQTSDPTGAWNEYFFQINDSNGWMDYPHAGVGDNYIFMGGNIFAVPPASGFVESRLYAFNKADLYAGSPVSVIEQGVPGGLDTPQPVNLHGISNGTWPNWGNTHYFLAEPYNGTDYTLLEWDTSTLTNHGSVAIGTGLATVNSLQNGGSNLQGNDFRPQDFEYRNGYGWTTMTNGCNPGSGTVNCVTWAQIDLTNITNPPTIGPAGFGTYGSDGDYRSFPDLAVNACDDMVVGYTKTSSSTFPGIWYTGRESSDSANMLQAEAQIKAGEIAYTAFDPAPHRWGDYTGMTIDPDGATFWYLGEYSKDTGTTQGRWGTYITSLQYASCGSSPDFTLTTTPASQDVCVGDDALYMNTVTGIVDFNAPVTLSTAGLPAGVTDSFSTNPVVPTGNSNLTLGTGGLTAPVGAYDIDIIGQTATRTHTSTVEINLFGGNPGAFTLQTPTDGGTNIGLPPTFSWTSGAQASTYLLEVATDSGFSSMVYTSTVAGTSHVPTSSLSPSTTYYWRVTAENACGTNVSSTASFTTMAYELMCNSSMNFELGIPGDWSLVDNSLPANPWVTTADATACSLFGDGLSNDTPGGDGIAACISGDYSGSGSQTDSYLCTSPLDLTNAVTTTLQFDFFFDGRHFDGSNQVNVLVGTNGSGGPFTTEATYDRSSDGTDITSIETINLSGYTGQSNVTVCWQYDSGWNYYTQVDDVQLTCSCAAPAAPPVTQEVTGSDMKLTWTGTADKYEIHWSTAPYYTPGAVTYQTTVMSGTSYTHTGAIGSGPYYYYVLPVTDCGTTEVDGTVSNHMGTFDFAVTPGD